MGYRLQFRIVLGPKITLIGLEARWLLRWNSEGTVFDWESFKCQSCRYWHVVFMSLDRFSSIWAILDAEQVIATSSAYMKKLLDVIEESAV